MTPCMPILAGTAGAHRGAIGIRPADAGEHRLRFPGRHTNDVRPIEGLGGWGEKKVLGHITASDVVRIRIYGYTAAHARSYITGCDDFSEVCDAGKRVEEQPSHPSVRDQGEKPVEGGAEEARRNLRPTGGEVGRDRRAGDGKKPEQQDQQRRIYRCISGRMPFRDRMQDGAS